MWLANIVMINKTNKKWRMCVDFTYLNKAFPKDCYLLPCIDALVYATIWFETLRFLDTFSGYHQIRMAKEDQVHTSFQVREGIYYYEVMPFGLKITRATYQRMINKAFQHLTG